MRGVQSQNQGSESRSFEKGLPSAFPGAVSGLVHFGTAAPRRTGLAGFHRPVSSLLLMRGL